MQPEEVEVTPIRELADRLEGLEKAATPGNWSKTLHSFHTALTTDARPSRVYRDEIAPEIRFQEDCDLICALRNAAPQLIQSLRRLAALEQAMGEFSAVHEEMYTEQWIVKRADEIEKGTGK